MATHSSTLAWRIPGTEEPGQLPSMLSHRVGHDWSDLAAAAAADFLQGFPCGSVVKDPPAKQEMWVQSLDRTIPWRKKWQPTPVFWPGKSHGQRSLGRLRYMGVPRVGHDLVTKQQQQAFLGTLIFIKKEKWNRRALNAILKEKENYFSMSLRNE